MCFGQPAQPKFRDPPPLQQPEKAPPPPKAPSPPPEPLTAAEEVADVQYGGESKKKNKNTSMGTASLKIPVAPVGTGGINIG